MKSGASLLGLGKYIYYDFLLFFMLTGCNGCSESDSKWRREAIERYKTRVTKSRKRITYFRRSKNILSSLLGSTSKLRSLA